MMMTRLLRAVVALALVLPWLSGARADTVVNGQYFYNVPGSTITRPADVLAYAANETVCASKASACVPGTFQINVQEQAKRAMPIRMTMLKSGSSTTNATFTIWLYSAPPVLTSPTQEDATAYAGPRAADIPNYIGSANCTAAIATSDSAPGVWYECALSNPNTAGALIAQNGPGVYTFYYLLSVTAAYTPASAETFTPYISGLF